MPTDERPGTGEEPRPGPTNQSAALRPVDRALPQLDALYREVLLDHYKHPRGRTRIGKPSLCSQGFNPTCGDQVLLAVQVDGEALTGLEVQCQGCSISVASGSMMAELLQGKTKEEVQALIATFRQMMHGKAPDPGVDIGDLDALSGVAQFPVRVKCALLAWTTLQDALKKLESPPGAGAVEQPQEV